MNIKEMLEKTAGEVPQKEAIVRGSQRVTYRELDEASSRVSNALIELGVKKGDHVAILMSHTPEWMINYFGVVKAGGIAVLLNSMFKAPELDFPLRNSDSKMLITEKSFSQMLSSVLLTLPLLKHVIEVDGESYREMMASSSPISLAVDIKDVDEAAIIYTSGVLGHPKGVVHTHASLMAGAEVFALGIRQTRDDSILDTVPFFHVHGLLACAFPTFLTGSTLVIPSRLIPRTILEIIERERITWVHGPTALYLALMQLDDEVVKEYDHSSLRGAAGGGMALPLDTSKKFQDRFGIKLMEGYGMTEVPPIITIHPYDKPKSGTIGKPVIEAKLLNDQGEEVRPGEAGEIVVRGSNVMKGYYKIPELNAQVFREGWFHTGDLATMDEEAYYVFVDKKSFMIKTFAGNMISPAEVENVLLEHPSVSEVAVVGAPDRLRGEVPNAFVVLKQGERVTAKELRAFCRQRLADFKVPRKIALDSNLAKTASGKVDRARLKELASQK
jgi:long-chain acyl-CoA synthetase